MKLHERIRQYIEGNKLTIKDVGEQTNIELKRFYRIMAGDSKMTADEFEEICESLNVDPGYFFKNNFLVTKNNEEKVI